MSNIIATKEDKDSAARRLSKGEDEALAFFEELRQGGADPRWLAIGITHFQQATMCIKRAVYDGKRVTDDSAPT